MRAMILAAGRGERMMPLTANKPKPMLLVNGKPLLEYHVENLAAAGITEIVINYAWCGQAIIDYFGNGERWGVNIQYSDESTGALETAGGIIKALPLLLKNTEMLLASTDNKSTNDNCFWVINGDVFCSFNFNQLPILSAEQTACIWLVENPEHNLFGDFCLENGWVKNKKQALSKTPNETLTFSGIALYQASFFCDVKDDAEKADNFLALGPLLRKAATDQKLIGIKLTQPWFDIGTPERLQAINTLVGSV